MRLQRAHFVHAWRLVILALIVLMMRLQASRSASTTTPAWSLDGVRLVFPSAVAYTQRGAECEVRDAQGSVLGNVLQTSPYGDRVLGFSGPTKLIVGLDAERKIERVAIHSSADTRDHVQQVRDTAEFFASLRGLPWDERPLTTRGVDAVSGATLTSLAILEALELRQARGVSDASVSRRFPTPPKVEGVRPFLGTAEQLVWDADEGIYMVFDGKEELLGRVLRTSPAADGVIGYQGPTETLLVLDRKENVLGLVVGASFDNEPYVGYVREDDYFAKLLAGRNLRELSTQELGLVEGVSGATMTSQAVIMAVGTAAQSYHARPQPASPSPARSGWAWHDLASVMVIVGGSVLALVPGRGTRRLNRIWQGVLILYLGLTLGCVLSQAMLVGWAQHGVPWKHGLGLVCLGMAAFSLPILTRRNVYCSHLCPHGALQQLVRPPAHRRVRLGARGRSTLARLPAVLLLASVWVGMGRGTWSLVDIEPFDAYVWKVAGWWSLGVAIVGIVAACFVPMAYCRFGCPTGMLLNHVRFSRRAGDWTHRDSVAVAYLLLACWIWWI